MSSIKTFLKNYLTTARCVITHPYRFYQEMPVSGGLKEPLLFAVLTIFIVSLLYIPLLFVSFTRILPLGPDAVFTLIIMGAMFLYTFFTMVISLPINSILYHIMLKIFGAKETLEATFRVFCYYIAISLVVFPVETAIVMTLYFAELTGVAGIIFQIMAIVLILAMMIPVIYSFYVLFVGFSEVHQMSIKRVILALLIIPAVLVMVIMALMLGLIFFTEQSGSFGTPPTYGSDYNTYNTYNNYINYDQYQPDIESPQPVLTAHYQPPPIVDGYYTPEDRWDEAQPVNFTSGDTQCTIAAKHDGIMLYILLMWEGEPEWTESIRISFEQDGNSHDHDRYFGLVDEKYNGSSVYRPSGFYDAHNDEGVMESEEGSVRGNYDSGMWVQEWVVPLNSGDPGDIYVNEFPTTLGFAVQSWEFSGPHWPSFNVRRYDLRYWGDLEIRE